MIVALDHVCVRRSGIDHNAILVHNPWSLNIVTLVDSPLLVRHVLLQVARARRLRWQVGRAALGPTGWHRRLCHTG